MKNIMKKTGFAIFVAMNSAVAYADGFKLSDPKGTSGAGDKSLRDLANSGAETAQSGADFAIIVFCLIGVILFGGSLYAAYKAGKDDSGRETPKGALWGMGIGAALTCVTLLLGMTRNTFGL